MENKPPECAVVDLARISPHELAPKYEMTFGLSQSLAGFKNYRFFTPALLYLYGRFTDAPLIQFLTETKGDTHIMYHKFKTAIFAGLEAPNGDTAWNYVLWAVEAAAWPLFENAMLSSVFYSAPERLMNRVGAQDLHIVDPLAMDYRVVAATLDIVVFGVDGIEGCVGIDATDLKRWPPYVRFYPPQPKTLKAAKALLTDDDPVAAQSAIDKTVVPTSAIPPFRTTDITTQSAARQAELLKSIADYRKESQ